MHRNKLVATALSAMLCLQMLPVGKDDNGRQLAPWHQDVLYISELKEFVAASQCFSGPNPDGSVLHLTKSKDGVNWQQVGTLPLLFLL